MHEGHEAQIKRRKAYKLRGDPECYPKLVGAERGDNPVDNQQVSGGRCDVTSGHGFQGSLSEFQ